MNRNNDNNGKCREFSVIFLQQHQNRHPDLIPIPKMLVDKDDDRNAVCQGGQ